MLRKLFMLPVVGLLLLPAVASAQFNAGDWELALSATGYSHKSTDDGGQFGTTNVGGTGSLGYFPMKELEASVRESLTYQHTDDGTEWPSTTEAAVDYHFDLDKFQPFVGAEIGYFCGSQDLGIKDGFEAGPEVGLKYFVNASTFLFGRVEYQISFENCSNTNLQYALGVGFKF